VGAWGEGVFENDAAGDWLKQLVCLGKSNAIDKAISFAIKAKPGRLEADEASEVPGRSGGDCCGARPASYRSARRGERVACRLWIFPHGIDGGGGDCSYGTRA
jgi:hypothetical protein